MDFFKSRTPLSAKRAFAVVSVIMFFFSAQVALTIYVDSSYLASAISHTPEMATLAIWANPERMVGTLYTFASLITILALVLAPRILRRHGNYRWTLGVLILHVILLAGLSLFNSAWLIIPLFVIETAIVSTLYFNLDVFLERYSNDAETGMIRGLFLVIGNVAWLLPPFFAGRIVDQYGFQLVYLLGALIMVPTIFIMIRYFSNFEDLEYDDVPLLMSRKDSAKHPDIGNILTTNFFLQFFYAWMVIYTPLYFHDHLGMSYADFGLILMIALTAFTIFPYPTGWIADKLLGEKELLVAGLLLMAITSALIPVFASAKVGIFVWAILLFIGRTGASTVETMSETYFFKQIDGRSAGLIGYFRRSRPLAYIAAPITASVLLQFGWINLEGIFSVLGGIMLLATYFPLQLKDTK